MPKLVSKALTNLAVRKARPKDKRYDLYDAALRGFGVRVATSGAKTWFVMRRVNGRMIRHTIGRYPEWSLAEARGKASEALKRMASGEPPGAPTGEFFEIVLDEWFKRDQAKNRSVGDVRNAMAKHVLPAFGGRSIDSIRKADVLRLIDKIVDSGAPVQANRVLAYLRRFFNWCIERDLLRNNPAAGVKAPAKEVSRERVLSLGELQALMVAAARIGYPWGPMVKLLVLTSQRLEEVAGAPWQEFDLERAEWSIPGPRTKNRRPQLVHLSGAAQAVIQELPRFEEQPWLFSTTGKGPVKGFSKAKVKFDKESGVTGWTFHDIRRSFATHATERLGISPVVVDKVQNHVTGALRGVAAVYQRGEYLEQRKVAMSAWAEFLAGLQAENVTPLRTTPS